MAETIASIQFALQTTATTDGDLQVQVSACQASIANLTSLTTTLTSQGQIMYETIGSIQSGLLAIAATDNELRLQVKAG